MKEYRGLFIVFGVGVVLAGILFSCDTRRPDKQVKGLDARWIDVSTAAHWDDLKLVCNANGQIVASVYGLGDNDWNADANNGVDLSTDDPYDPYLPHHPYRRLNRTYADKDQAITAVENFAKTENACDPWRTVWDQKWPENAPTLDNHIPAPAPDTRDDLLDGCKYLAWMSDGTTVCQVPEEGTKSMDDCRFFTDPGSGYTSCVPRDGAKPLPAPDTLDGCKYLAWMTGSDYTSCVPPDGAKPSEK